MGKRIVVGAFMLGVIVLFAQSSGIGQVSTQTKRDSSPQARKYFNFTPVEITVPIAPTPVESGGKMHLVYELHMTNFVPFDLTLMGMEVLNGASSIANYKDEELTSRMYHVGVSGNLPEKRIIGGGMRVVIFIWLTVDKAAIPSVLSHRFAFKAPKLISSDEERIVEGVQIFVHKENPVVITPPFRGGTWAASNGPSNTSGQRQALFPYYESKSRIAQRFAFDWFKLGDKGKGENDAKLVDADPKKNENWYGYGTEVLGVADAVVSAVKDGIPENVPLSKTRAVTITSETVAGNYVIVDLGQSRFAFYAHLQPGSIRVKAGDKVRRGQALGLLGNSGNSDSPHLHFHIVDGNSPIGSEGLPFVFESYEVLGVLDDLGILTRDNGWRPQPGAIIEKRSKEMPLKNTIIRFP